MRKPKHWKLIILISGIFVVDALILFNYLRQPYLKWRIEEVCSRGWEHDWKSDKDCLRDLRACQSLKEQLHPEKTYESVNALMCVE